MRQPMKLQYVLIVAAAVCGAPGLTLVFAPEVIMAIYGLPFGPGGVLVGRALGSALISLAVLFLCSLRHTDAPTIRGVVWTGFLYNAIDLVVIVATTLSGTLGLVGWAATAPHVLLTLGFGYFLLRRP